MYNEKRFFNVKRRWNCFRIFQKKKNSASESPPPPPHTHTPSPLPHHPIPLICIYLFINPTLWGDFPTFVNNTYKMTHRNAHCFKKEKY